MRVKPTLDGISNISLILLVLLISAANIDKVLDVFGTRAIFAGLLFVALGFAVGWVLGGPGNDTGEFWRLGRRSATLPLRWSWEVRASPMQKLWSW